MRQPGYQLLLHVTYGTMTFRPALEQLEDRSMLAAAAFATVLSTQAAVADRVAMLPASAPYLHEWNSLFLQLWISTPDAPGDALVSASTGISFNDAGVTARQVRYGSLFDGTQSQPQITDGQIDSLSASASQPVTAGGDHLLFAEIAFDCRELPLDFAERFLGPYGLNLQVSSPTVELQGDGSQTPDVAPIPPVELWALPYDGNDDEQINFGDFALFAGQFLKTVNENSPLSWWADFNQDTRVNFADFALFAASFLAAKPGDVILPDNFPEAWRGPDPPAGPISLAAENVTLPASDLSQVGSFEVYLQTTVDPPPELIAFQVGITVAPSSSGLTLTHLSTPTLHPYLFPGSAPAGNVDADGQSLSAGDLLFTAAVPLVNGAGLVEVHFEVAAGTTATTYEIQISADPIHTFLVDEGSVHLPFAIQSGQIEIVDAMSLARQAVAAYVQPAKPVAQQTDASPAAPFHASPPQPSGEYSLALAPATQATPIAVTDLKSRQSKHPWPQAVDRLFASDLDSIIFAATGRQALFEDFRGALVSSAPLDSHRQIS